MGSKNFSFAAKVKESGDIRRIISVINEHNGIVKKVLYNSRIDSSIAFFEIANFSNDLMTGLIKADYILSTVQEPLFIKIKIHLPRRARAISEILTHADDAGVIITLMEFDTQETKKDDTLVLMLNAVESQSVKAFLDYLKTTYAIDIVEYTPNNEDLDNTIFYITYANRIRRFAHDQGDHFVLSFLADINSIAFELKKLGYDPEDIFMKIYENGETLHNTIGSNFYADYQMIQLKPDTSLHCFQLPCGGNVYILENATESLMIDTGYGIYHDDIMRMCQHFGLWQNDKKKTLFISHGDADHCGGAGYIGMVPYSHPETIDLIRSGNRAYKSVTEVSKLEQIYTTMIGTFSKWLPPDSYQKFQSSDKDKVGAFPVFGSLEACGYTFTVLESHGGHQYGQLFLLNEEAGLFFTVDSCLNLKSISPERTKYNQLADLFMTSVNVDSDLARKERKDLLEIAADLTAKSDRPFYICCGHGAISTIKDGKLAAFGQTTRYRHS